MKLLPCTQREADVIVEPIFNHFSLLHISWGGGAEDRGGCQGLDQQMLFINPLERLRWGNSSYRNVSVTINQPGEKGAASALCVEQA